MDTPKHECCPSAKDLIYYNGSLWQLSLSGRGGRCVTIKHCPFCGVRFRWPAKVLAKVETPERYEFVVDGQGKRLWDRVVNGGKTLTVEFTMHKPAVIGCNVLLRIDGHLFLNCIVNRVVGGDGDAEMRLTADSSMVNSPADYIDAKVIAWDSK